MIVADTNLIVYLLVSGEFTDSAKAVRLADSAWIAPGLWRSKFCNVVSLYTTNLKHREFFDKVFRQRQC
jgi:predicted nucleic acid-binding protein